jgi:[acyl-carrier-protein] S-malonyltransferase
LLKLRGQAMQRAVPVGEGAMAALIGLDAEAARMVALRATRAGIDHDDICAVANDNAPGQAVVSGHRSAVERAIAIAREFGGRRSVMLPVSAPFHSPLLAAAAAAMATALANVPLRRPVVPLVANVTARPVDDPDQIEELLVQQVTGMVRWRESVLFLAGSGVDEIVEIGTGRVLTGLVKRIAPQITARSVGTPADIPLLNEAV